MKRLILSLTIMIMLFSALNINIFAENGIKRKADYISADSAPFDVNAKSAILVEAKTGQILYSKNENEKYSPASVTKIMTLLIVMEAIEEGRIDLEDKVTISEYAASMGGSQVFLKEGEQFTVEELLKCTVIASANDCAVALAEYTYGSESAFVDVMNRRASELKMENTKFENVTGLDDDTTEHLTSSMDISIMSRELIKYPTVLKYSSLWQDSIRNGEFTLTNTNRLVRYYDGCTGLKTGSTDKAGYCISATATRNGMELICVIMGAPTRDVRNTEAKKLLDYAFSNYALYDVPEGSFEKIPVYKGKQNFAQTQRKAFFTLVNKSDLKKIEVTYEIPEHIVAPYTKNDVIGKITYKIGDQVLGSSDIYIDSDLEKLNYFDYVIKIIKNIFSPEGYF